MIYYAAEILFALFVLLFAIGLYRLLIRSPKFNRLIETTVRPMEQPEQIEAAIEALRSEASSRIDQISAEVDRKTAALRRVRKTLPKS